MTRKIAIFDFDGTLIKGDSLPAYLFELAGYRRTGTAFMRSLLRALAERRKGRELRTAIKEHWLKLLLANVPVTQSAEAAERLRRRVAWKQDIVDRLLWHKAQGHEIMVATGALEPYIHVLLRELPVDAVLATGIASEADIFTGSLQGANSVRNAKAERVAEWLKQRGPYSEIWGYGNAPHDNAMLELCTYKRVV